MTPPEHFNTWTLLTRSLRVSLASWRNTLGLTLLFWVLPVVLWIVWLATAGESASDAVTGTSLLLLILGLLIVSPASAGAISYSAFQCLRGRTVSMGECLQVTLPRILPILWTSFVVFFLSLAGCMFCFFIGAGVFGVLYLAIPVAVVERASMPNAFSRSWALTEDYRLGLSLFVLLPAFVNYGLVIFSAALADVGEGAMISQILALCLIPTLLLTTLVGCVSLGVAYHDLRYLQEGDLGVNLVEIFE